jgi:hypothetical protein
MIDLEQAKEYSVHLQENKFDFCKLVYLIWPFGEKGSELEEKAPYDWQMEEWEKLSKHLQNPETRYDLYRLIISSGNGAAKTAFGAMTEIMLLYTHQLRSRITANTDPQMKTVVWPEYDLWYRTARFMELWFEKFGTSIKARDEKLASTWRIDTFTWSEESPSAISGLHNKGRAVSYVFEEAPGIPAKIWDYAKGAFVDEKTIKIWMAFGNSDDPNSKFEQNMSSPLWHSRRLDTRKLAHIDKKLLSDILFECNGNEDHDDFRVRVRGLPRKTAKDSIISLDNVEAAIGRAKDFDVDSVAMLPVILTCDPAWTGGDETVISYRQGNYSCLLDKYKLDRSQKENHTLTYQKLCHWENELKADAIFIDQAEGTGIFSLAQNAQKVNWFLISFASKPTDQPEEKMSQYGNIRAQMYYEYNDFLRDGGVLDSRDPEWTELMKKQLTWTKGTRHKVNLKKMAQAKKEVKEEYGFSPDIADSLVLQMAIQVTERLPENAGHTDEDQKMIGGSGLSMPDHPLPYDDIEDVEYHNIYDT